MAYVFICSVVLVSIGLALYALISKGELEAQVAALLHQAREQEARYVAEVGGLRSELGKLDKIKHIPRIVEKSRKLEAEIEEKLRQAQRV